jgi:hypothetical protein
MMSGIIGFYSDRYGSKNVYRILLVMKLPRMIRSIVRPRNHAER